MYSLLFILYLMNLKVTLIFDFYLNLHAFATLQKLTVTLFALMLAVFNN